MIKFFLGFFLDHNGKPSFSRISSWVWLFFSVMWINHLVYTTNEISDNALFMMIMSSIGPTFAIILKKAPPEFSVKFLEGLLTKKNKSKSNSFTLEEYEPYDDTL